MASEKNVLKLPCGAKSHNKNLTLTRHHDGMFYVTLEIGMNKIRGIIVEVGSLESGGGDGYTIKKEDGEFMEIVGLSREFIMNNNFLFDDVVITIETVDKAGGAQ